MRSSTTIAIVAIFTFAVVLASPAALAQVPPLPVGPAPTYTVAIMNAPPAFPALTANGSALAGFQVVLTLTNVICPQGATIPVTLTTTATGAPSYFSVMPEPSVVNFTIATGAYPGPPAGQGAGGSGDSAAKATITGNISANASIQVSVSATAAAPAGCQGAGTLGEVTSEPVIIFANLTAPPAPPTPTPTPEDKGFLPGPGPFLAILGAVIVAAMRRRAS